MTAAPALAVITDRLRERAGALASHAADARIIQSCTAGAYGRLDYGWQSYAREDVDAEQRLADAELARMHAMLDELALAARRAAALIEAADDSTAAMFTSAGVAIASAAQAPMLPAAFTSQQARIIFADMRDEPDIPFAFLADGCYARADAMMRRITERYKIDPATLRKAVVFGNLNVTTDFIYPGPRGNSQMVHWKWHIAPAIPVNSGSGAIHYLVIDPSLFDQPVTLAEWGAAMNDANARPQLVHRRVYGLDHFGTPIVINDSAAQDEARAVLDEYMGHCIARGYCAADLPAAQLDELRSRCIDAGICLPPP